MIASRKKGQGAFEYILLLAGILLIVVLIIVILKGGLLSETQVNVQRTSTMSQSAARANCFNWCGDGAWRYVNQSVNLNVSPAGNPFNPSTACTLENGLSTAPNASCFYTPTGSNGTCNNYTAVAASGSNVPPQNARFCGYFAEGVPPQ
ncbi:MAG: class III signal peptide-containing protein [Candidatus Micrarchaeota archaeon]